MSKPEVHNITAILIHQLIKDLLQPEVQLFVKIIKLADLLFTPLGVVIIWSDTVIIT